MIPRPSLFRLEIGIALIVKIVLIFSLKALFFSDPVDRNLSGQDVEQRFLGTGLSRPASVLTYEEPCDDSRRDC